MTKYVLNYWVYGIVALIFTGLYALITWSLCWEMFPISLCTLYLVRTADDYQDYDTDRKEKPLSRQQLRNLIIGLAVIFLLLHLAFFRFCDKIEGTIRNKPTCGKQQLPVNGG